MLRKSFINEMCKDAINFVKEMETLVSEDDELCKKYDITELTEIALLMAICRSMEYINT